MRKAANNARQLLGLAFCLVTSGCALDAQTGPGTSSEEPVDASASELRRSDFGMSRSLQVVDAESNWAAVPLVAGNTPTTVAIDRSPLADTGVGAFASLSWVGDANSYIDVFDSPLTTTFSLFGPPITLDGSSSGRFRRVFYPHASNAELTFTLGPPFSGVLRLPRAFSLPLPAGSSWRALRHYDRGECSQPVTYTTLLSAIIGGLTPRLDEALRAEDLGGATRSGPASATPTLRVGTWGSPANPDTFTVRADYQVGACDGIMPISFTGRFGVSGVLPTFTVTSVAVSLDFRDDFCAGWLALAAGHGFNAGSLQNEISAAVAATLRADLGPAIRAGMRERAAQQPTPGSAIPCRPGASGDSACHSLISLGLPAAARAALRTENASCMRFEERNQCMFVPSFRRINSRPDGLEVVLIETRSDPFYPIFSGAGVCGRPEGSVVTSVPGTYGSVSIP